MKKTELKRLLKPLVKECIHEVLLEEGLLANIVSEVAKGMQQNILTETIAPISHEEGQNFKQKAAATRAQIDEHRQSLMDSIGNNSFNGVNLFEGTEPPSTHEPQNGHADLGSPSDAGVDISAVLGKSAKIWRAIK